jgi:hypothetical protein
MATRDPAFFDPVKELVSFLNGQIRRTPEWEPDFRALAKARDEIENLIGLLRTDVEAARAALRRDFHEVEMHWDVFPDPAGHNRVGTVIQARTPKAFGISLLASVSDLHQLERVRQCPKCTRWFVARHLKRSFCNPVCQQDYWGEKRKTARVKRQRSKARAEQRAAKRSGEEKR